MFDVNVVGPLRVVQALGNMPIQTTNDTAIGKGPGFRKALIMNIGA